MKERKLEMDDLDGEWVRIVQPDGRVVWVWRLIAPAWVQRLRQARKGAL
jgi:hypothetical protein